MKLILGLVNVKLNEGKMRPLFGKQKEAHDRRDAAVHEAGHMVMTREIWARSFMNEPSGLTARIFRVEGGTRRGSTWNGVFGFYPWPDMSLLEKAMVGVAGVVAVERWRRRSLQDVDWDTMSSVDWEICDCERGKPKAYMLEAISAVSALFVPNNADLWSKLRKEARRLIEQAA
jgi:hypothetical protein